MDRKNKGVILCAAALAVLLVILVFQGLRHVPERQAERKTEAMPASGEAIGMIPSAGEAASPSVSGVPEPDPAAAAAARPAETSKKGAAGKEHTHTASPSPAPAAGQENGKGHTPSADGGRKTKPKKTARPKTAPVRTREPEKAAVSPEGEHKEQVSFCIQCTKILGHKELWKDGVEEIIPDQGIFYSGTCDITGAETAYDVLKRVCGERKIALDSQYTPLYGSYYIRGIGNLYEFDCGSESGWKYSVNGRIPNMGCSSYELKDGDTVVFFYDIQV